MKSKASLKGHPIHPMLIPFPFAFLAGALLFDIIAAIKFDQTFWLLGKYLAIAGAIAAIAAAIPGIIDYIYTVPPESSAKKRATKHGLINISAVIVFVVAILFKNDELDNAPTVIAIESFGVVLLSVGGWLGGTLSYRNQIGVDIRYAESGKWKEITLADNGKEFLEVAEENELKINQMKLIRVGSKRIVLGRTEKGYVAFDDKCSHKGGSLAGGSLICNTVQCPWHGSQFNVDNGAIETGPAKVSIKKYKITENAGKVYLNLKNI